MLYYNGVVQCATHICWGKYWGYETREARWTPALLLLRCHLIITLVTLRIVMIKWIEGFGSFKLEVKLFS